MPALFPNLCGLVVRILKRHITLSIFILCLLYTGSARAQRVTVELGNPPSIADAGPFVSPEGRFSMALPRQPHGYRPMPVFTPLATADGHYYDWDLKEGVFSAAYADFPGPIDSEMAGKILSDLRLRAEKRVTSYRGKVVAEKQITIDNNPGMELKIEFPNAYMVNRIYFVSRRMYDISALLVNQKRVYEAAASNVLDSFKILSEAEVKKSISEKEAAATPSPSPQF
jgi:hypothetical protein